MMMKITLRTLAAHKLRLAFTALAVVLGIAFVSGTLIFTDTLQRTFDELFTTVSKSISVQVRPKTAFASSQGGVEAAGHPIPQALVDEIAKVEGVRQAYGTVGGTATLIGADGRPVGGQGAPTLGVSWDPDTPEVFGVSAGRAPRGPDEIALDVASAKKAGLKVGGQATVVAGGPARHYTVTGLVDAGQLMGATVVLFDPPVAQRLLVRPGYWTNVTVRADAGVSQQALRARVAAVLPAGYEAITGDQVRKESESSVKQFLSFFNTFLLIFAAVSLFVGVFIIFNTFSILVAQRTRELALLRVVGASRGQVSRAVLGEALGVGLVGATLGLAAGAALAVGLRLALKAFGAQFPATGLVFSLRTVVVGYVIGVAITVVAAYLPARRGGRVPPVAALRDDVALPTRSLRWRMLVGGTLTLAGAAAMGVGLTGRGGQPAALVGGGAAAVFVGIALLAPLLSRPVVGALAAPFARVFALPGRLARDNALRNPRRTAATASALMIGLALVTTIAVLGDSAKASIDQAIDQSLGADYTVISRTYAPFGFDVRDRLAAVAGVASVTALQGGQAKVSGQVVQLSSGDPAALERSARLKLIGGTATVGADGLLMDDRVATSNGWRVGSVIELQFPGGERQALRVVGLFQPNQVIGSYLIGPQAFAAHYPSVGVQTMLVDTTRADPVMRAALERALAAYPNLRLLDQSQVKAENRKQITGLISFVTGLLVLSIIIAALGIINTLALSVIERTREIGLLRAVGTSRRQIRRMIRLEAVVVALFGALLGVAVGLVFGAALQRALVDQGLKILSVPVGQLVVYLVISGLIGVVAALWPAWRAARMDVLRAIAAE